jgi:multisubunit Na+/H+ antiporter MnhG subunit
MNDAIVIGEDLYYAISLNEILWGGVLLAITMFIHASGMVLTLRASEFLNRCFARSQSHVFLLGLSILIVASWMLIGIHLAEVTIWAAFYIWKGAIANPSMAFYLALVNYCSLNSGYLIWKILGKPGVSLTS